MKFEQGKTYNTVKTLGLASKNGYVQLSQRVGLDGGSDVLSTENLTFEGRKDSKLWFVREDGTRIVGHPSHFDPAHAYNKAENKGVKGSASTKLLAAKARLTRAEEEASKAAEKLAALQKELVTVNDASSDFKASEEETQVVEVTEDMQEASALFAE